MNPDSAATSAATAAAAEKRCLVLGATGGIGAAVARQIVRSGWRGILSGRRRDVLDRLEAELGDPVSVLPADLHAEEGRRNLAETTEPVDGLVYAAGVAPTAPLKYLKDADLEGVFQLNTMIPLQLTRDLLKKKKLRDGASIVWISSISARRGTPGYAAYAGSKAALEGAARCLAVELAPKFRINCVAPGMLRSDMAEAAAGQLSEPALRKHFAEYPLGPASVDEVAEAAFFLLSDASRHVSGTVLTIDGGMSAGQAKSPRNG